MGLSTILSNRSVAMESFYLRSIYAPTLTNFLVLTVPTESYLDLSYLRIDATGSHFLEVWIGFTQANPIYNQFFNTPSVGINLQTMGTSNKIIMPPGSSLWVSRTATANHILTMAGTMYKVTP